MMLRTELSRNAKNVLALLLMYAAADYPDAFDSGWSKDLTPLGEYLAADPENAKNVRRGYKELQEFSAK